MGARNTSAAFVMWSGLSDGAFRLLVGMGHRALDEDAVTDGVLRPARRFYGGVEDLVTYVRSTTPQGAPRSVAARRSAAFRYLAELREAGAVKITRPAVNGRRAEYALNLDPMASEAWDALVERAVDRAPGERSSVRPARTLQSPTGSDAQSPTGSDAPRGGTTRGTTEEQQGGQTTSTQPPTSRAASAAAKAVSSPISDEQYAEVRAVLERTVGAARAVALVGAYLDEHPDAGYRAAVLAAAAQHVPAHMIGAVA